ncbi:MAG TPA: DUF1801 domain-containing protein [Paludibacter sp.]|nr:DUF1801 domain-containing protein [Paludibacter sp.]
MNPTTPATTDSYIGSFPHETQQLLEQLRTIIKETAPEAEEKISYGMPGYKLNGMLIYFAGYVKHIGFYPGVACIVAFKEELSGYKTSKGTVQFPLNKPLPTELIIQMVKFKIDENLQRKKLKQSVRKVGK